MSQTNAQDVAAAEAFARGVFADEPTISYAEASNDVREAVSDAANKVTIAKHEDDIAAAALQTLLALDMTTSTPDERLEAALAVMEANAAAYKAAIDASAASFTLDYATDVMIFTRKRRRII